MAEVLIVEPQEELRRGLARVLTDRGHVVFTAEDAEEALSVAAQAHPTVVLVDMSLEEIPGYDLVRCLRNVPPFHQAWIAAIGEHAPDPEQYEAAGLNASVTQRLEPEQLYSRLSTMPGSPLADLEARSGI